MPARASSFLHDSPCRRKRGPLTHLAPFMFAWRRRDRRRGVDPDRRREPQLLPCSGPVPGTAIGSSECAGSAAAGKAPGHGPAQASCRSHSGHAAIRTDLSGTVLPHHFAAGDDDGIGGTAAGRADARKNPRSVDIAAAIRHSFAARGSALRSRFCCVVQVLRARPREASGANPTATFRHCRCCRRRSRIARAPGSARRQRQAWLTAGRLWSDIE